MINPQALPENVLRDLLERGHSLETIAQMSTREAFDEFLNWNGIINYTTLISEALLGIIEANEEYQANTPANIKLMIAKLFPKSRW